MRDRAVMTAREREKAQQAQVHAYKSQIRTRVELLRLQYEELDLTLQIHSLEQIHRETFPELYQSNLQQTTENITKVTKEGEISDDGVTDNNSESDEKES